MAQQRRRSSDRRVDRPRFRRPADTRRPPSVGDGSALHDDDQRPSTADDQGGTERAARDEGTHRVHLRLVHPLGGPARGRERRRHRRHLREGHSHDRRSDRRRRGIRAETRDDHVHGVAEASGRISMIGPEPGAKPGPMPRRHRPWTLWMSVTTAQARATTLVAPEEPRRKT